MNIVWATVIGLVASIVGGILSGLFVMRKMTHDNKRVYANQIYHDLARLYSSIANGVFYFSNSVMSGEVIREFTITFTRDNGKVTERISFVQDDERPENIVEKPTKDAITMFRQWLQTDTEQKAKIRDEDELISLVDESAECIISDDCGIKSFIDKYPLQISHFGKLYELTSQVDYLKDKIDEIHFQKQNSMPIYDDVVDTMRVMLDILEDIYEVFLEVQYYHTAKSWTWRIFVPLTRN